MFVLTAEQATEGSIAERSSMRRRSSKRRAPTPPEGVKPFSVDAKVSIEIKSCRANKLHIYSSVCVIVLHTFRNSRHLKVAYSLLEVATPYCCTYASFCLRPWFHNMYHYVQ